MSKGERTRRRMIKACSQLLRRRGYAATALRDIVEESGAPNGSLYFHFPNGKEELAQESVRRSVNAVADAIDICFGGASDPGVAMKAAARLLAANLERSGFRDGCPVGTVTLEMAAESNLIRDACAQGFDRWQARIAAYLEAWGLGSAEADDAAALVICAFEGALMLARARHDTEPLALIANRLTATVNPKPTVK